MLDDVLLVNSVLCMIAYHDLVFGRCCNKEPHSSGILLCRVVVVGYEKCSFLFLIGFISTEQPSELTNRSGKKPLFSQKNAALGLISHRFLLPLRACPKVV